MISILVKFHILRTAWKHKQSCPKDINKIILNRIPWDMLNDIRLIFLWILGTGNNILNASEIFNRILILNSEWAYVLIYNQSEEVDFSLRMTIGHELTHMEKDFLFIGHRTKDKKFVDWINEIHADFGGTIKAFNQFNQGSALEMALCAIYFKANSKGKKDKDSNTHPSWKRRYEYVKAGIFDDELINKVASDVGCNNDTLIASVCRYYDKIILK